MKEQKIYDRQTKKWVHLDNTTNLSKRKLCKGSRPHDYALTVPTYMVKGKLKPEMIAKYYEIKDWHYEITEEYNKRMKEAGFNGHGWNRKPTREYICTNCGKRKF